MNDETLGRIRAMSAMAGGAVEVACCPQCAAETVLSSAVVAENGRPGRCPQCGSRELTFKCFRWSKSEGLVELSGS